MHMPTCSGERGGGQRVQHHEGHVYEELVAVHRVPEHEVRDQREQDRRPHLAKHVHHRLGHVVRGHVEGAEQSIITRKERRNHLATVLVHNPVTVKHQ